MNDIFPSSVIFLWLSWKMWNVLKRMKIQFLGFYDFCLKQKSTNWIKLFLGWLFLNQLTLLCILMNSIFCRYLLFFESLQVDVIEKITILDYGNHEQIFFSISPVEIIGQILDIQLPLHLFQIFPLLVIKIIIQQGIFFFVCNRKIWGPCRIIILIISSGKIRDKCLSLWISVNLSTLILFVNQVVKWILDIGYSYVY